MIYIEVEGDADLRDEVIALASNNDSKVQVSDEQGYDGAPIVQLVLEDGAKFVALVTSVLKAVEIGRRLQKNWSVKIGNKAPKRKSRK
jgi:hypothetical protein